MFKAEVFFGGSHFLSLYLTKSRWTGVAGKTNAPPGGPNSFPGATRWFQVPCLGTSPTSARSEPRILSHSHDIWNVAALQAFGNWARLEKGEGGRAGLVTEPAGKGPQGGMRTGE